MSTERCMALMHSPQPGTTILPLAIPLLGWRNLSRVNHSCHNSFRGVLPAILSPHPLDILPLLLRLDHLQYDPPSAHSRLFRHLPLVLLTVLFRLRSLRILVYSIVVVKI